MPALRGLGRREWLCGEREGEGEMGPGRETMTEYEVDTARVEVSFSNIGDLQRCPRRAVECKLKIYWAIGH